MLGVVLLSILTLAEFSHSAEKFPSREITIIVNFSAGGPTDLGARFVAQYLQEVLSVPVVIENRPEAAGVKGVVDVFRARPDGYTLLANSLPSTTINEVIHAAPYKILDFTYLGAHIRSSCFVSARRDSPYKTLKDLIEASKKKSLNCSTTGIGSLANYLAVCVKREVISNIEAIPFKGAAPAIMALLGGNVDLTTVEDISVRRQIEKVRPLAIMSNERSSKFPDVPTLKELGYDIPVLSALLGICGPPALPAGVQKILSDALAKAIKNPEFIRKVDELGASPIYIGPEWRAESEFTYKEVTKNKDIFMEKK
jgi:tripartite-type tricarboxylate transporter receptor subunit TctC